MYYSTKGFVEARKTKSEGEEYLDRGYVRVEESAICVVRFKPFWNKQPTIIPRYKYRFYNAKIPVEIFVRTCPED